MNLLFCVDENYAYRMLVTLFSVLQNTSQENFSLYVIQAEKLSNEHIIADFCEKYKINYHSIVVGDLFSGSPITDRYPESVYYRLLAHEFLPDDLDKILYLDADILIINDIFDLYKIDLKEYYYAASVHTNPVTPITNPINEIRLGTKGVEGYYNSGMLLMNLPVLRENVKKKDIHEYIKENRNVIIYPDQDVLNGLYGHKILHIPDSIYNYDTRFDPAYFISKPEEWDIDWVIENTIVLHFCGRDKPWGRASRHRYAVLYKHYEQQFKTLFYDKYLDT